MCVCVGQRERESVHVDERVCVCVGERECVYVWVREREDSARVAASVCSYHV